MKSELGRLLSPSEVVGRIFSFSASVIRYSGVETVFNGAMSMGLPLVNEVGDLAIERALDQIFPTNSTPTLSLGTAEDI